MEELLEKERRDAEEAKKLAGEASQPTTSSTTISLVQATEIRAQIRQAIQEGFAKARAPMGEIPKEQKMH